MIIVKAGPKTLSTNIRMEKKTHALYVRFKKITLKLLSKFPGRY